MSPGNDFPHLRRDAADGHTRFGGQADQVDAVAEVIGLLGQGEGNADGIFRIAVDAHASIIVIDSHHTVVTLADTDALSTGIATLGEEVFIDMFADDTHLAAQADVHVVDIASVAEFGRLHLGVVGHQAFQRTIELLVTMDSGVAPP